MHRKKPFSGKQKKQQLKDSKMRKKDGPAYLVDDSDDDEDESKKVTGIEKLTQAPKLHLEDLQVQKINQQPGKADDLKLDTDSFRLHFFKESDEVMKKHQKEARKPLQPSERTPLVYRTEDVYPPECKLDFPKRPPWSYNLTKEQLDKQEKQYFRSYVSDILDQPKMQDLSYFELNLETWRQLWRVLEISDILLIIADIRYPVLHIPPSLISHILHDLHKSIIIILNKADFVPAVLALAWKHYLQSQFPGIHVIFFTSYPRQNLEENPVNFDITASLYRRPFSKKAMPLGPAHLFQVVKDIVQSQVDLTSWEAKIAEDESAVPQGNFYQTPVQSQPDAKSESCDDSCQPTYIKYKDEVVTIGCIGYPNVGKSSVLNALMGKKVVSVSKTPGHTKHLQTIFLCPSVKLCDCPGLVFPSMVPKALQIIAGIFPVAQVREPYSVVGFVAKRLDLPKLLHLTLPASGDEGKCIGDSAWSALDICEAWAIKNGFTTSKAGRPDTYRAANKLLRLAVEGQLCLCFMPPKYGEQLEALLTDPETEHLAEWLHKHRAQHLPASEPHTDGEWEEEEEEEEEENDRRKRPNMKRMLDKLQDLGLGDK